MKFALDCDTCEFHRRVDDEERAYSNARDHEREHGDHFVLIETVSTNTTR